MGIETWGWECGVDCEYGSTAMGALGQEHMDSIMGRGVIPTLPSPCSHSKRTTTQLKYSNIPSMMMGLWGQELGIGDFG